MSVIFNNVLPPNPKLPLPPLWRQGEEERVPFDKINWTSRVPGVFSRRKTQTKTKTSNKKKKKRLGIFSVYMYLTIKKNNRLNKCYVFHASLSTTRIKQKYFLKIKRFLKKKKFTLPEKCKMITGLGDIPIQPRHGDNIHTTSRSRYDVLKVSSISVWRVFWFILLPFC